MKRNWELIDSIVKTIAESDKDIFGVNDFKSAETSEKEIKYTLKLMLDRGLVFDETTRYGVVQVGQLTWGGDRIITKAKYRQTKVYEKDHLDNLTPAALAAGFFFAGRCVVSLFVLHINLKRKNPQKNKGF